MPPACVLKVHEGRYGKEETRICASPKPKGRESKDKKRETNQGDNSHVRFLQGQSLNTTYYLHLHTCFMVYLCVEIPVEGMLRKEE